ncbi:hypothetical protein BJY01DRAFT_102978 [Aspergillus pseudoustus]|uniref:Uncharacterized protein n=1 Tax=Aspergillus pseudoustus TaxID=1810923 RepID=A0ABR4IX35_9EURO
MALRINPTVFTTMTKTTAPRVLSRSFLSHMQTRSITLHQQQHTKQPHAQDTRGQKSQILTEPDRTILSPERAETSYSGTDNKVGDDTFAYDPSVTNPESEFQSFEDEIRVDGECDPLFISPANRDFSQTLDRDLDGRAIVRDKGDRRGAAGSVRGWVNKHGTVRLRKGEKGDGEQGSDYERMLRGLRRMQMNR